METQDIGAQLFTARAELATDFAGTLQQIAAIGYQTVELIGFEQVSSAVQRPALDASGLRAPAVHIGLWQMTNQTQHQIAEAQRAGAGYIIIPWLEPEWRTPAKIDELGTILNQLGKDVSAAGMQLGYHHHDFEFALVEGQSLMERLIAATDPALVTFELDVYWAAFAGHDPMALLHRWARRISLVHLKDMAPDRTFTEVGDGTLDMPGIIQTARANGVAAFFVEHDQPQGSALASLRRSFHYLQGA